MRFNREEINLDKQDRFGHEEVGITHPSLPSFIRANDDGDIEIVISNKCAIILHKKTESITFVADSIKFLTKDGDSIRWNNSNLNSKAVDFTQPALVALTVEDQDSVYDGSEYYYATTNGD